MQVQKKEPTLKQAPNQLQDTNLKPIFNISAPDILQEVQDLTQIEKPDLILSKKDGIVNDILQDYNLTYNALDDRIYIGERYLKDSDVNDIAIKCRTIDKSISESNVLNLIRSSLVPTFDPRLEYIKKLNKMPLKIGMIKELFSCIQSIHSPEYMDRIVKKWFGGIVGTLLGDFSVMSLILIGGQGIGKSLFFRNILPKELRPYLAEASVKDDKDYWALMCSRLILCDDEFTSKTKTEAAEYKKIVSAPNFTYRTPFGKINETRKRTAVLCGSANEADVISDRTGNRRIIPLNVSHIDHIRLSKINLDNFYRELLELSKVDPNWWYLTPDDIEFLKNETSENLVLNEDEELLQRFTTADPYGHVSTSEVVQHLNFYQSSYRANIHKLGRELGKMYGKSFMKSLNGNKIRGYPLKLVSG